MTVCTSPEARYMFKAVEAINNPKRLIGVCGFARAGKDTIGRVLTDFYGFERLAFADKLRDLAYLIDPELAGLVKKFGYEWVKDEYPTVREYLVRLGKGARDVLGPDVWLDATLPQRFGRGWPIEKPTVVTDVRYANEAERIKNLGGEVWEVVRPNALAANYEESRSLALVKPDRTILNSAGINDLVRAVHAVMKGEA